MNNSNNTADKKTAYNSTFAIGGVSCSASTLVVKIPPIVNLQNISGYFVTTVLTSNGQK
jgi:hypothetical protein